MSLMSFIIMIYTRVVMVFKSIVETQQNLLNNLRIYRGRRYARLPQDLNGKIVVITGANSGIGKYTTKICFKLGAKVLMLCRDLNKARLVREELLKELLIDDDDGKNQNQNNLDPNNLIVEQLDLSSFKSIRKCAEQLKNRLDRIDYLINNAGIMMCPESKTEDGYESQFATNHLGHFLLTNLLMDLLKNSPKARIINLSSIAHIVGRIHFDNINLRGIYNPMKAYGQSKLANVLFTLELAKRLNGTNITTYAVHPGLVNTELGRYIKGFAGTCMNLFRNAILISPELGAQTTLYCAFEPNIEHLNGKYFANCQHVKKMYSHATNEDDAKNLWDLSLDLCGLSTNNNNINNNNHTANGDENTTKF